MKLEEAIKHCLEVANRKEMESEFETDCVCYAMTDKEREEYKKCAADHRQLAEWLTEAKRLLKAAVEDFTAIAEVHAAATPILCPKYYETYMKAIDVRTRKWRYANEALALIGEEGGNNA